MKPKTDQRSLYELLRKLHLQVVNERDLGSLLGYGIVASLLPFQSLSRDETERRYEQVKSCYDGLDLLITSSRMIDSYALVCEMKARVDPAIENYHPSLSTAESKTDPKSQASEKSQTDQENQTDLLSSIFQRLTQRSSFNPEDRLVRDGIALYHRVMDEGKPPEGRKNTLTQDYRSIEDIFVRGTK